MPGWTVFQAAPSRLATIDVLNAQGLATDRKTNRHREPRQTLQAV